MAWDSTKNDIFFRRFQNWAGGLWNLLEERDRLIDLYQNEALGDPDFVDTDIATVDELSDMATVMAAVNNCIKDGVVPQEDRVPKLTPFLIRET